MKLTIYLPDALGAEVKVASGAGLNVSAVCQDALRDALGTWVTPEQWLREKQAQLPQRCTS